jgi:hypothetical protein
MIATEMEWAHDERYLGIMAGSNPEKWKKAVNVRMGA